MKIVEKIKNENKNENIFWKFAEKLKMKIDDCYRLDNWGRPQFHWSRPKYFINENLLLNKSAKPPQIVRYLK